MSYDSMTIVCNMQDWSKIWFSGLQIWVCSEKLFFLFLNQIICCWYSKETIQWEGYFGHPKHMFKLMGKIIITLLR